MYKKRGTIGAGLDIEQYLQNRHPDTGSRMASLNTNAELLLFLNFFLFWRSVQLKSK